MYLYYHSYFLGFIFLEHSLGEARFFGTAGFFDDFSCGAGGLEAFNVVIVGGNVVDFDDISALDRVGTDHDDGASGSEVLGFSVADNGASAFLASSFRT